MYWIKYLYLLLHLEVMYEKNIVLNKYTYLKPQKQFLR